MGYFSELSITLTEQQELLADARSQLAAGDYPTPVQQLIWRLEDLEDRLKELVASDNVHRVILGQPVRSWRRIYREWPEYWATGRTEAYFMLPKDLNSLDEVLSAIASTQKRLFFYGVDADAERKKQTGSRSVKPLDGQVRLPLAS